MIDSNITYESFQLLFVVLVFAGALLILAMYWLPLWLFARSFDE